jgi:hypothetical protein
MIVNGGIAQHISIELDADETITLEIVVAVQ